MKRNRYEDIQKRIQLSEPDKAKVNGGRWYKDAYDMVESVVSKNQEGKGEMSSFFPKWPTG